MTPDRLIALALSFERLSARISARPVTLPHPVIKSVRHHRVTTSRRGTNYREEKNIEA